MYVALILKEDGLPFYGDIPEVPFESNDAAEVVDLDSEDWPLLDKYFIDEVNNLCDTLFDLGDADYLRPDQCVKLRVWLMDEIGKDLPERLKAIYDLLLRYCDRAIELGTGVVLEP